MSMRATARIVPILLLAAVLPGRAAEPAADAALRTACEGLKLADFTQLPDAPTRITESTYLEAGETAPAACLARGYVAPQVGFEMKLPARGWNGKLLALGSGGFTGSTQVEAEQAWCDDAVRRGYACIHSDYGHTAGVGGKSLAALDGLWGYGNLQAEIDYAYRGVHVVGLAEKAIARRFYGAEEKQAYFMGCSNGGRQAMVAAQRYPQDFDGVVAMEPAIDLSGAFTTFLYNYRAVTDAQGRPLFSADDLALLKKSAVASCDLDDGVADGVIGDPRTCAFDPGALACGAGAAAGQCLSPAQVAAARKVYAGPMTSTGRPLYHGHVMPGGETGSFGFAVTRPLATYMLFDFFRYLAFLPDAGPQWKPADFDFDRDPPRLATMEQLYDAADPDLREFKRAGGKLIIVQGWEDGGSPFPLNTIDYYETMQRTMGGPAATRDFARLFMMPGRSHCAGGDGASSADFLAALERWAEQGEAPEMLKASHVESANAIDYLREADPGLVRFTRPVYPYPLGAKYKGSGDPKDYRSFKPVPLREPQKP